MLFHASTLIPILLFAGGTNGTDCWNPGEPLVGPDLIVGNLSDTSNYQSLDGIDAFAIGADVCNIGSQAVSEIASTNQHHVYGQNLFRLRNDRMEQIGQSWPFHEFTVLTQNLCGCGCDGQGGSRLGVGCSSSNCCGLAGSHNSLGPKFEVDAFSGFFLYPPFADNITGDSIYKRLQVHISDIDPAQNGGGLYFAEVQLVAPDDSAFGNQINNASYRRVNVTGSGTAWNFTLAPGINTVRTKPAIRAWRDTDPEVTETDIQIPGEGLLILAVKATQLSDQLWHHEYALQNLNSHRSVGSFIVPLHECAVLQNLGFHDVDYHSGEPFDGTDWPAIVDSTSVTWSTTPYDVNPDANALRWGTLYNFRFDANLPPRAGNITLGLFRPGTPDSVTAMTIVPTFIPFGDIAPSGGDGLVDMDDLICCLGAFANLSDCPDADLFPCGGDGAMDLDDLLVLLESFSGNALCAVPCPP